MNPPKIFISATSADLSSARQIAKDAVLTINCHPVEQTNFEPDWRSVTDMLRGKIGDCQALIHLVGFRYGAEPDPATLPSGTPRRSYTQMEYHLARELGLRVYTFLLPETYPYDVPKEADTPEQSQLQAAHRSLIQSSPHLYEKPASDLDLRTRIIALQEKVIHMEQEQQSIAKEVKTTRHWGLWAAAAILLIFGGWQSQIVSQIQVVSQKEDEQTSLLKEQTPRPRALDKGEISVVVVMGEDVEYEKRIRDSFLENLRKGLEDRRRKLSFEIFNPGFAPGSYAAPDSIGQHPPSYAGGMWTRLLNDIEFKRAGRKVDYFVTLGTYATKAIMQSEMHAKHNAKLIYLGVTDPVRVKFVGNPDTAGVQYGTGGKDYGKIIDSLFKPGQRLVFLFNEKVIQDEIFSKDLEALNAEFAGASVPNRRTPRFEMDMKPKEVPIDLIHIQKSDPNNPFASPIYFAWYGLDNILSKNGNCAEIFTNKLWVVPSTYSYANLKSAGVIVSVVDQLVGELGAGIVLRKVDNPQIDLGQIPVLKTPFHVWICRKTIRENHLDQSIRPEILDASQWKKRPWVEFDDANQ